MFSCIILVLVFLKVAWMYCGTNCKKSLKYEKTDILQRRNYLIKEFAIEPECLISKMPDLIGTQFQHEWALYSSSMFNAALANISKLFPETSTENGSIMDVLIQNVMSETMRSYDTVRWGEDALDTLDGCRSHLSYISHLAWMIADFKAVVCNDKYDALLDKLCKAMYRRIEASCCLNLPTYPGEPIYIPDMLVAILALHKVSLFKESFPEKQKYAMLVRHWIDKAKTEWLDDKTGMLVSVLNENGTKIRNIEVRGSYSALNCYYLSQIDKDFAKDQYARLKSNFLKPGLLSGIKEYVKCSKLFTFDVDAGPLLLNISPSGTAFAIGPATFFNDYKTRRGLLLTAEFVGHSVKWHNMRCYLLSRFALVGEAIMLAMRTTL